MHRIQLLYEVTHTLLLSEKKHIVCFSDQRSLLLPQLSQLRFLFINELSAYGIVLLCRDQKFINVSCEKIDIKIDITILFTYELSASGIVVLCRIEQK